MSLLNSSIRTPDYGLNGVVSVSTTETGTNSATDVLSLDDAKDWMKVDGTTDNSLITILIGSIIDFVEREYSFQLIEKNVTAEWESYGQRVDMPLFPVQSVSSVKTINNQGTETTLAVGDDYYIAGDTIVFNSVDSYEAPFQRMRLKVEYVAGFTTIPSGIIIGLKKAILSSYEDRQDLVEGNVSMLPNGSKSYFKKYLKLI